MLDRDATIRRLESRGLEPRRVLGQNFVVDAQLIERIVGRAGLTDGSHVVEIGPGLGALTGLLTTTARKVVAVEKDERLAAILPSAPTVDPSHLEVVVADALDVDWNDVLDPSMDWMLVANLPYNVAVPIVMAILERAPMVQRCLVMVQLEVAERLAAGPGGRTIGVPSIHLGWFADAEVVEVVPPEAFHPVPRVSSALVEVRRRRRVPSDLVGVDDVMALVGAAYRKRRKMLRTSLAGMVPAEAFEGAGIDPGARPETLTIEEWVRMAEALDASRGPGRGS